MKQLKLVCKNPWCKAPFDFQLEEGMVIPIVCPKCESFDKDLSGGVTWTDKKYDGSKFDGLSHQTRINVEKYMDRKRKW